MPKLKSLTLINPDNKENTEGSLKKTYTPSAGLGIIGGLTKRLKPDVNVSLIDERIEKIDFEDTDLVGITVMTANAKRSYEIADKYKKNGVPVIFGGYHPTFMTEEALQHGSVVAGEAEFVWPQVLHDFEKSQLKKVYCGSFVPGEKIMSPDRSLFKINRYWLPYAVSTGRGCPNGCTFCSVKEFSGSRFRSRPLDDVVKEAESFGHALMYGISDDNLVANKSYATQLFKELAPLKKRWVIEADLKIAQDLELLRLARKAGVMFAFIGFESLNPANILEKKVNRVDYEESIKRVHDEGISIVGAFIFGFDEDDKNIFKRTAEFCNKNKIEIIQLTILTPFPGTPIYKQLKGEGRILTEDWSKYDACNVVFNPENMSPEELQEGRALACQQVYSFSSIVKRTRALNFTDSLLDLVQPAFYTGINLKFNQYARNLRKEKKNLDKMLEPVESELGDFIKLFKKYGKKISLGLESSSELLVRALDGSDAKLKEFIVRSKNAKKLLASLSHYLFLKTQTEPEMI